MRRRSPITAFLEEDMEKGQGKTPHSRVCLLASLTAFFWLVLFYFHFVILGGSSVGLVDQSKQLFTPVSLNTESSSNKNAVHAQTNPSRPLAASPPKLDVHPQSTSNGSADSEPSIRDSSSNSDKLQSVTPPSIRDSSSNSEKLQSVVTPPGADSSSRKVENYPFLRALRTVDNKSDPCGGRYIYVHDLPRRFNEDMIKECKSLSLWTNMCKFISNAGLGPPLENAEGVFSNTGWYATNQFAVDVIFNNRMKQYDCLTKDSSLAAAIFVPFYAGFDIARYLWGYNTSMRDAASLALIDWLTKKPEWGIMGGKDHFLVAGRITWDFRRRTDADSDWGNKLLFLPATKNMSMLVVESSPWKFNDFGIPYPTYFHPAKDADMFNWQDRMRKQERKWLFCFAGARRPGDPKSIRDQIIDQCKKSKVCKLLECDLGESKCHSPSSIMQMFQSSVFCLQPQGDSYTRRSAFDSILAGCIPVFFHPASAYTQYTWHLPKNISKYSVLIPGKDVLKKNISIEEWLSQFSQEQVKEMGEEVIKLIPRITYADPRSKLETVNDAFDVAVQAVINSVTKLRRDVIEGYRDDDRVEEIAWKYALLDEGRRDVGLPHEWDPYFEKENDGNTDSSGSSAEAAKNSWKIEQRQR